MTKGCKNDKIDRDRAKKTHRTLILQILDLCKTVVTHC